ncbi:MAG: 3-deoxy-7-phosphoheptulonate synthase [Candidatus Solincola sediminis]|uniref:3-deoxy-7-phosphoheptulonate synthase n=1 Tax=Candidatus Solincola sediminis TaxID=1797199 RepID=A0A1F2WT94_9ACTN|nr:MAG: 3-deoxy-7-phosphoheptulonate synthase [Candidatus Solincola sediminis]OFW60840.1 MAG: 3-deoxy-7-phosphoheptulonate synthase [Candidatus Solincola sediminis]
MVIVMREGASKKDIDELIALLHEVGAEAHVSQGEFRTVIGVIGDREKVMQMPLEAYAGVEKVVPIMKPYKLVSREFHEEPTVIKVRDAEIGGGHFNIIAGPCSVESEEQVLLAARAAKAAGAEFFRGGAFKPRSSPYSFQGLAEDGLKMLAAARDETGLPVVTEVLDVRDIELVSRYADVLQVGARNMQNFLMLKELGYSEMPILLKRGMSATIEEWMMAAEYILKEGNKKVILCERGIRTFETATRNTLDISSIPIVKGLSHLPIFVDPSHATGVRELVPPLCRAALAAGADGVMVEIHPNPREALCDGSQSLTIDGFGSMMEDLKGLAEYLGRK